MRRTSVLAWVAALLALLAVPGPFGPLGPPPAGAAPAAACARGAADRAHRWFEAAPPLPARGLGRQAQSGSTVQVRAAALDPADPRVVLATDGTRVQRSDDGGCTWREVWTLDVEDTVSEIAALDVAHVAGHSRVLLVVVTGPPHALGEAVRLRIVRSDDGRGGWTTAYEAAGVRTAAQHGPGALVRSGAGATAYAALPSPTGAYTWVATADGRTWEQRTPPGASDTPADLNGAAASPWDPAEVWQWHGAGPARLRVSRDGARTWRDVDPWPTFPTKPFWEVADVAWPRRNGPARIVVAGGSLRQFDDPADPAAVLAWSGDGGTSWGVSFPPRKVSFVEGPVTHTARGDAVLTGADGRVYLVPYRGRVPRREEWRPLAPLGRPPDPNWPVSFGLDAARTSAPGVVLVPDYTRLRLLAVPP
ncbi:MAG TPA: sialidase family protein [Mycobacteriales bacterium]